VSVHTKKSKRLLLANELFRAKNYAGALSEYKKLQRSESPLARFLDANIKKCEVLLSLDKPAPKSELTREYHRNLASILDAPIDPQCLRALPSENDVLRLLKTVSTAHALTQRDLCAIASCASSSPFQLPLLNYLHTRIANQSLLAAPSEISAAVNLRQLLFLLKSRAFYLKNRAGFRRWLEENRVSDSRAYKLLDAVPSALNINDPNVRRGSSVGTTTGAASVRPRAAAARNINISFGTIFLNEQKYLGINLLNHYELCDEWVLVEGACLGYPSDRVTQDGLSIDGSSVNVELFPDPLGKLRLIRHGWTRASGEDAKSELRNRYLSICRGGKLVVIDADEFYNSADLQVALALLDDPAIKAVSLPQVHFWKSTEKFITGGYYDTRHTRIFRNEPGMRYLTNHNFPELHGHLLTATGHHKYKRTIVKQSDANYVFEEPVCFHMGFVKDPQEISDKNNYYLNRGEAVTRVGTTVSRAAWFQEDLPKGLTLWTSGFKLPTVLLGEPIG
jgi:hypothetical protein